MPLVSIVFGTMYLYGSREFIELLLAQPVGRGELFAGLYAGLALPLAVGFLLGVGLPFLWDGGRAALGAGSDRPAARAGTLLTLVFTALAFLVSLLVIDRARGTRPRDRALAGVTALYDALLVLVATTFADYPLELPLLGLTLLNPVDLARVSDAAAARYRGADGVHRRRVRAVLRQRLGTG